MRQLYLPTMTLWIHNTELSIEHSFPCFSPFGADIWNKIRDKIAWNSASLARTRTYPERMRNRRCGLLLLGMETGGIWSEEAASFAKLLAHAKARQPSASSSTRWHPPSSADGRRCWPTLPCNRLPPASLTRTAPASNISSTWTPATSFAH